MRELDPEEYKLVSGGLEGTKIPFTNGFIPGQNAMRTPATAVTFAVFAFEIGWETGGLINDFNEQQFGMTLGVAIHRTFNGGSKIGGGGSKLIPTTRVEEMN